MTGSKYNDEEKFIDHQPTSGDEDIANELHEVPTKDMVSCSTGRYQGNFYWRRS